MKIVVTGSIAFDYLMSFPGRFTEHFLPEHMNRISLSFLVDTMVKRRGGCAPNIAYTMALLGERPLLMATAGEDFGEYRQWLEAAGIDTSLHETGTWKILRVVFLAAPIWRTTDRLVLHGPIGQAGQLSFPQRSATAGSRSSRQTIRARCFSTRGMPTLGIPYIFDPGQQCARMSGDELSAGVTGATSSSSTTTSSSCCGRKTGLSERDILAQAKC